MHNFRFFFIKAYSLAILKIKHVKSMLVLVLVVNIYETYILHETIVYQKQWLFLMRKVKKNLL